MLEAVDLIQRLAGPDTTLIPGHGTLVKEQDLTPYRTMLVDVMARVKALREPDCFDRVVRACPWHAHWLDGTPITGVMAMAGVLDRYRRFVLAGRPVVTGYATVGDAWACTNPSAGRGLSVGLVHAQLLRDVVREHLDDPRSFVSAWHERTEEFVAPFYWNQVAADRTRIEEMTALQYDLPLSAIPGILELKDLVHEADEFCRAEALLTVASGPQESAFRDWYLGELVAQAQGAAPTPWPGEFVVTDPTPMG